MSEISFPTPSHMPFIASGSPPDFLPQPFCCVRVNDTWKIAAERNGVWQRLNTGLPEDTTECAPTAEWADNGWIVSFIAGGSAENRAFYLYRLYGLDSGEAIRLCGADVGFTWKQTIVHGGRRGTMYIQSPSRIRTAKFVSLEYLYRASYHPRRPRELLISGKLRNTGEVATFLYHPGKNIYVLTADDGQAAYKAAFGRGDELFYARQTGESFEDRQIVQAGSYRIVELNLKEEVREGFVAAEFASGDDPAFE